MTQDEKRQFINDLCQGIKESILIKVDRMPEEWDGHQLRRYVKEVFAEQAVFRPMSKRNVYLQGIRVFRPVTTLKTKRLGCLQT